VRYSRPILIIAILLSIVGGVALFFVPIYYIIGPIVLIPLLFFVIRYPVLGLYAYLFITYLRPQDLFPFLVKLRPSIFVLALSLISLLLHRKVENRVHLTLLINDKLFIAFLAAAVVSNVTSIWITTSLENTMEFLKMGAFYFLSIMLLDKADRIYTYVKYYLYSVGFVSLVQIYTYLTVGLTRTTGKGGYGIIVGGTTILGGGGPMIMSDHGVNGVGGYSNHFYANSSEFGLGMCVAYPICYFLATGVKNRFLKMVLYSLTFMMIISIVFSGSRGAFVAFAITLGVILYKQKKLLMGLVILAFLSGPIIYLLSDQYINRIKSIGEFETDESVNIRFDLWTAAASMIADYPVFGVGIGNFPYAYGSTYRAKGSADLYWAPHNVFIQIASEMGLVGFSIYLAFLWAIVSINRKSRAMLSKLHDKEELLVLAHGIDVALIGYIVAGQFITATYYPHVFQLSVWATGVYIVALRKTIQMQSEINPALAKI